MNEIIPDFLNFYLQLAFHIDMKGCCGRERDLTLKSGRNHVLEEILGISNWKVGIKKFVLAPIYSPMFFFQ